MEGHLSTVCALILILGVVGYSDASVKPGSCPQFQGPTNSRGFLWQCKSWPGCSNDNNCPGQLKCCRRGCASVCVAPVIVVVRVKPGSCPQIHGSSNSGGSLRPSPVCKSWPGCSNDNNCPGQLKCCRRGCASVCVAPVRVVVRVKPGSCPQVHGSSNSRAFSWPSPVCKSWPGCSNDNNCPGQLKCCRRGCASVCVAPVRVVVRVKPGSCPQVHGSSNSRAFSWPSPVCKSWPGCSNDNNCPGQLKCCRRGCASVCVAPVRVVVRVKPGSCPQVHGSSSSRGFTWPSVCKSWPGCSNDYDCPGRHKCCRRGCRSVCLAPAIKPLSCPPIRWNGDQVCAFGSQRRQCSTDKPCPRGFACCKRQCGQVCTRLRSIWND